MEHRPLAQQQQAIAAPPGPVLVVAGPGAGKTFCLIGRINHLIAELGFKPERILAVTFTNRAAEEIASRLKSQLPSPLSGIPERAWPERSEGGTGGEVKRGTLHALCLEILREHAQAAGLRPGFGVADEQYQRTILARLGVAPKRRGAVLTYNGRRRLSLGRYAPRTTDHASSDPDVRSSDERLYDEYLEYLGRRNILDFDGLIAETHSLLTRRPDIAAQIAARWDYILVDEFQDLNTPQYEILKVLAAPHKNFFAVGDDEQSIFSWTGADPLILKRFRDDFAIAQPIILDKNLRCSRQIFDTARRVLAENPQIFAKQLTAERESPHDVMLRDFVDEAVEAAWLVADLEADRALSSLSHGQYAILYRKHSVAEYLEGQLLKAGIPCRLARGRSVADDDVVGWVIGALRVLRDPHDPVALEAFAGLVFSEHLLEEVRAYGQGGNRDFLDRVRSFARIRSKDDPDTKKLWRFVFFVENLPSLHQQYSTLQQVVHHLLSQRVGAYTNVLEDRHDELTDPADMPEAVALADRLRRALVEEREVYVEQMAGLEIALRGMLIKAGFRRVPLSSSPLSGFPERGTGGEVITAADAGSSGLALTLFKALQLVQARDIGGLVDEFVAFDFETTDGDIDTCDIVELGVARVRNGNIVDQFRTLVRPSRPISAGASKLHGYTDADVATAPTFAEVWPTFRAFVGDDLLVAHNGQYFDVPVLRRLAGPAAGRPGGLPGADSLVFYDTLPLARSLSPEGASLTSLAARFEIDGGRAHHALDDAITLARVFIRLERERQIRARKAVFTNGLDWLGLALALERGTGGEAQMLAQLTRFYTLGRFSDCLETYAQERSRTGVVSPMVEEIVDRLGGAELMAKLRAEPDPAQKYPAAVARLSALMDSGTSTVLDRPRPSLSEEIDRLLDRVALSTSDGVEVAPDRVNLLTLHSTKGLEFSRVYVVGVEDYQIPGYYATVDNREDEIQESRRLLYVGMTRAKDRLVLTRVDQRFGRDAGGSMFLEEMQLTPEHHIPADSPY